MKMVQSLLTLAKVSLVLWTLGIPGVRAQSLRTANLSGAFTLPFNAQWGAASLPPGEYKLYYGHSYEGGPAMVEVVGKENRAPHAMILAQIVSDATGTKNALVCVREGDAGIIRALELPQIGKAIKFYMPRGARLIAQRHNANKNVQIAEGPMLIQRIPVTLSAK